MEFAHRIARPASVCRPISLHVYVRNAISNMLYTRYLIIVPQDPKLHLNGLQILDEMRGDPLRNLELNGSLHACNIGSNFTFFLGG